MKIFVEREYDSKRVLTPLLKPISFSQNILVGGTKKSVEVIIHARGSDEIMLVTRGLPPKILRQAEINTAHIRFDELHASCLIRYLSETPQYIQ